MESKESVPNFTLCEPVPGESRCVLCGNPFTAEAGRRLFTDTEECHAKLIDQLVTIFGEHKKVIDLTTGKAYKVPVPDILERGLRQEDLTNYPEWSS